MAKVVVVNVVKPGDRAGELLRSVGMELGRFGGRVEEGRRGEDAMVVFHDDRDVSCASSSSATGKTGPIT